MDEIVYSVVRRQWDSLTYGSMAYWDKIQVIGVFRTEEDARRYSENDAEKIGADISEVSDNGHYYYGTYTVHGVKHGVEYRISRTLLH